MTILNNDELRKEILKAGHVQMEKIEISQKMYSNNTVSPLKFKNQKIVQIGIDDLMQLISHNQQQAIAKAVEEARKDQIHKDLGGLPITMPIKSARNRNTAFKRYAVKFFNGTIKKRRETQLAQLSTNNIQKGTK